MRGLRNFCVWFFRTVLFALLPFLLSRHPLQAVPPLGDRAAPSSPACHINQEAYENRLAAHSRARAGFAPPIAPTTYKIAVIRIDFTDKPMSKTLAETQAVLSSFKSFYIENSYGMLTAAPTVSNGGTGAQGAYRMPSPHSYYAKGIFSDYEALVKDGIAAAEAASFDFSQYDHIVLYHAGDGAETTHDNNLWSVYLTADYLNGPKTAGKTFSGLTVAPETEGNGAVSLGVLCHEYGHQLGLPDLYNSANSQSIVGVWSLMDYGAYSGYPKGGNPAHLDAWSKQFLGFSAPETVSLQANMIREIRQSETERSAFLRVPVTNGPAGSDKEYFLVEYRRRTGAGFDNGLPGDGVLIWHVDDSIASDSTRLKNNSVNTGSPHYGVSLVPAGTPLAASDWTDAWTKSNNTPRFAAPKSNSFNGMSSGVEIDGISHSGGPSISLNIRNFLGSSPFAANGAATRVVIAGGEGGFVNPGRGERAQIGLFPEKTDSIKIRITNAGGELVSEQSALGSANSQSFVTWDGRDQEGQAVASGIYFVNVEGGGIDSVKKVAVIK